MNLSDLIEDEMESLEHFLARTYWTKDKVFIFNSVSERDNPDAKPSEVWDYYKAQAYAEMLRQEVNRTEPPIKIIEPEPEGEIIRVSHERLGEEPEVQEWIDSWNGKVKHKIGGAKNGN